MSSPTNEIERGVYQTPSNDDDLYDDYDDDEGFGRGPVFAIFAVIVLAAFVGVVWLAYQQGLNQGRQTAPPIITASNEPFKTEPTDPQGMEAPEQSLTDNALAGQPLDQVTTVTTSSEAPIEVPETTPTPQSSSAARETASIEAALSTPELRTTRPATTQAPAGSSGGLVVPPPSSRVRDAAVDENLQTTPSTPVETAGPPPVQTLPAEPEVEVAVAEPVVVEVAEGPPAPGISIVSVSGNYVVQVASFPNRSDAVAGWVRLQFRHGPIVGPYLQDIQAVDLGDRGTWYRLRFGYFDGRSAANSICDRLKVAGQDCLVTSR